MPTSRPTPIAMLAVVCISLAWLNPLHGTDEQPAELKDIAAARNATTKYDKGIKAAQQDFERKLQLLRQEYEEKTKSARKAYVAALKSALAEETKKGNLEVAVAVKKAIAKLEAEAPAAWPAETLPVTAAAEEGDGVATIPATKGVATDFNDEKKTRQLWTLPENSAEWQVANGALRLTPADKSEFTSRFTWTGDATVELSIEFDHVHQGSPQRPPTVSAFGETIELPAGKHQIVFRRKGDKLTIRIDGKENVLPVKESARSTPSRVSIAYWGSYKSIIVRGIRITTKAIVLDPSEPFEEHDAKSK